MCNIQFKTSLSSIDLYKVVFKFDELFVGCFSGEVVKPDMTQTIATIYQPNRQNYNADMIGRCVGYESLNAAKRLRDGFTLHNNDANIIKIRVKACDGWPIMRGIEQELKDGSVYLNKIYAGSKVEILEVLPDGETVMYIKRFVDRIIKF
jgi:hypothetical protein